MTPKEQKLMFYIDKDDNIFKEFKKYVSEGWTVVQITSTNFGGTYMLLHKYWKHNFKQINNGLDFNDFKLICLLFDK